MKDLILYAHPNPKSFNAAILSTTREVLESNGHQVTIRDLYTINFNPVLKRTDFELFQAGKNPADIEEEHNLIKQADLIIMLYPIWWTGIPAILKGYLDRVFSYGFAYKYSDEGDPMGLLTGKKGLIINTQGTPSEYYDSSGMTEAMKKTSDTGILGFCGIESIGHIFFGAVPSVDDATRKGMLEKLKTQLNEINGKLLARV